MDELFRPPGIAWQRLSSRYLKLKLTMITIVWPILIAAVVVPLVLVAPRGVWITVLVVFLLIWVWRYIRAPYAYRRWGYAETDTDVYLTNGLLTRNLECVPYGRMQVVNVSSGPIERLFKLSTVQMVTSSVTGTITIPGLESSEAAELRDRLIERGESQQAGI